MAFKIEIMYAVIAIQISNALNIRHCRQALALPVLFSDSDELFLKKSEDKFVYIFQYGVVAFFNHNTIAINDLLRCLDAQAKSWEEQELRETIKSLWLKGRRRWLLTKFESLLSTSKPSG